MRLTSLLPLAALLLTGGCVYDDYASGQAPSYPAGYGPGVGPGWQAQPGDLFGGQNVASIDVFYQPLSPYGRWIDSQWGRAFVPNAPAGWRPYVNGRWAQDRFWISGDPWGWATDHYGRWGHDQRIGWVWVPDRFWGPSWVAWRDADDLAGWAPIPPGVSWNVGVGFGGGWGWNDWNSWYAPAWVWVPRSHVFYPGFGGRVLPWNNGWNYWRGSRWQHGGGWNGGGWNGGGWNGGGWNGGGWNGGGWNRPGNGWRQPRNGAPGSVGDRIGRGMAGLPPPQAGQGRQGRPGQGQPGQGWNGNGWNGNAPGLRRNDSVSGRVAGGMRGRPSADAGGAVAPPMGWQSGARSGGAGGQAAGYQPSAPVAAPRSNYSGYGGGDAGGQRMAPPPVRSEPPASRGMSVSQRVASGMSGGNERPD